MNHKTLYALAFASLVPVGALVACSGDDTPSTPGPQNKVDSGTQPDTSTNQPDTSTNPPGTDAGPDSAPNVCANGVVFDNANRIPGWPTIPQP